MRSQELDFQKGIITARLKPGKEYSGCCVDNVFYLQYKSKHITVDRFLLLRDVLFLHWSHSGDSKKLIR